jgi:hypothetical protein
VTPDEPVLAHLDALVARLAAVGIEQFVATEAILEELEKSVSEANLEFGFTVLLAARGESLS